MSQHFNTRMLLRFVAPSIAMMVFTSIYGVVDGLFVTNFAGKTAFAAINLIMPFIMILATIGFMMGSGGSALIARTRGEGDDAKANAYFSLITYFTIATGIVLASIGAIFVEDVARLLGADESMLPHCVLYGRISMISLPLYLIQYAFQVLSSTAGKPKLGLYSTVAAGLVNMALDFAFVGLMGMGVSGAAFATVISEYVGGLIPLVYFARKNESYLKLGRPSTSLKALGNVFVNGSSEMIASIAFSVVSIVYNFQLMNLLGEDGVAAYGTIMYAGMIFAAVIEGFCMGTAPLMSYQFGAHNSTEMRSLLSIELKMLGISGVAMFALAQLLAYPAALAFASYDANLLALTVHAFRIYSWALLLMGFSMYGSSLFTALNNGLISALIAFLRTLVFEIGSVLLLPLILGPDGIWFSVVIAEIVSCALTFTLMYLLSPHYGLRTRHKTESEV